MATSKPARILYMEDDFGLARLFQKKMKRAGYIVDIAKDAHEGLSMYEEGRYDVVAVDYNMPEYNGLEIIKDFVSREPTVQTLMITGQGDELTAVEAMKLGAGDYVIKDVDGKYFEMLPSVIERLLDRKRLLEGKLKAEKALHESEKFLRKSQEVAHIGSWKLDLKTNRLFGSDEAYRILGLIPQVSSVPYEAFLEMVHPDDRKMVVQTYKTAVENHQPYDIIHRILKPDGTVRIVYEKSEEIVDEQGEPVFFMGMIHDVTERVQAEEQLKSSLKEKEILLSEVHHRVKNNMQIITSLLRLQTQKDLDKKHIDIFREAENRIRAMALVHEKIYRSNDFASIELGAYIKTLAKDLAGVYGINAQQVKVKMEIEDVSIGLDNAVPCGLIISELLSNSMKYAFPEDRAGEIKITLRPMNQDEIELTVSDDGVGMPEEIDIRETESLGLQLVNLLAENQLEGTLSLQRDRGTSFTIRFKK